MGEEFEFLQQVEVGVRWKLTDSLAIESEFGLQHISNAGLAKRNAGVNALGVSVGVQWTSGCWPRSRLKSRLLSFSCSRMRFRDPAFRTVPRRPEALPDVRFLLVIPAPTG